MGRKKIESLPLYPESRPCHRPTTRRVIDLFAGVQSHTLTYRKRRPQVLVTELTHLQGRLLRLFALDPTTYGH